MTTHVPLGAEGRPQQREPALVFRRSFRWDFEGEEYDQEEWFFLVRVDGFSPESNAWTDTEAATIRGTRWWSIEELRSADEEVCVTWP